MKKTWKFLTTGSLITALLVGGCASPRAAVGPGGLTTQQLHNVGQPSTSSWLPKFMQPGPAQPKFGGDGSNLSDLATSASPAPKSARPRKTDSLSVARLHERRGQLEQAVKLYERELASNPRKAFIHHRLAVIAAREGRWDSSREHFTEACRLEPRNSELLGDLGYALYLQHQLPEAEQCLQAAVEANPQNKSAQNNLGIVLGVLGKYDESLAAFRRAVPEAEAHANLGYVHMQLGDADRAMNELNHALTQDSSLKTAAIALVQLNDLKQRLTPKDLDRMMLAKQATPTPATSNQLPVADHAPQMSQAPTTSVAFDAQPEAKFAADPAPRVGSGALPSPASVAQQTAQPQTIVAEAAVPQRPLTGYAASELKPRASSMSAALAVSAAQQAPVQTSVQATIQDSRIRELPERLPAPTSKVSLEGLVSSEPASKSPALAPRPTAPAQREQSLVQVPSHVTPHKHQGALPIATLADPTETVTQASAQENMAPQLLKVPNFDATSSVASQRNVTSQPVPVVTPSKRIQQIRSDDQARTETQPGLTVAAKPVAPATSEQEASPGSEGLPGGANGSLENHGLISAVKGAHAVSAQSSVVKPTIGASPSLVPQVAMPRPADMIPAQMNQLPTHQLHPTASPTWTAPSQVPAAQSNSTPAAVKGPLPRVKVMPN